MAKILSVVNQKGGVGKTTTAITVAHNLVLRERRVLLVDFDPQGQCATSLAVNPEACVFNVLVNPRSDIHQWIRDTGRPGLDLIPGDRSTATAQIVINAENRPLDAIRQIFRAIGREYDFLIFDTAPSVGGIQERAIFASDLVLVPTATEYLSIDGLAQMLELLTALREKNWNGQMIGILPTFYDEQTSESSKSLNELQEKFKDAILPPIHRATILRECTAEGKTIFEFSPASRASREYEDLGRLVIRRS